MCSRGKSERSFKVTQISNQAFDEDEFDQWRKFLDRSYKGSTAAMKGVIDELEFQVDRIEAVRAYRLTHDEIEAILHRKQTLEFQPQQESRMRAMMQCTLSQMDVTAIRDRDAKEQADDYNKTVAELVKATTQTAEQQDAWFQKRSNLYSLKEINRKNFLRQQNRDRHALDEVVRSEAMGKTDLNPFERRACRPVCAWDTKLTFIEGQDQAMDEAPASASSQEPAAGAAEAQPNGTAPVSSNHEETSSGVERGAMAKPPLSRLNSVLMAHRRCNLLAKLGSAM
jgi:hypothetical protein